MRLIQPRLRAAAYMAVACAVVFAAAMPLIGQDADDRDGRRRGRPNFRNLSEEQREQFMERMRDRMQQMQERRNQRLKESLGMSNEEFAAVLPMIDKVRRYKTELEMASRVRMERGDRDGDADGRGRGGPRGRRGPGGPGPGPGPGPGFFGRLGPDGDDEMSSEARQLRDALQALRDSVQDDSLSSDQVRTRIEAARKARSKMNQTIERAENELRQVLLARQEATLLVTGVLD